MKNYLRTGEYVRLTTRSLKTPRCRCQVTDVEINRHTPCTGDFSRRRPNWMGEGSCSRSRGVSGLPLPLSILANLIIQGKNLVGNFYKQIIYVLLGIALLNPVQTTANNMEFPQQEKLLIEVLDEISRDHQVYFTYDSDIIKGLTVDYEKREGESVRSILTRVLSEVNMDFKIFEDRFIILYRKDEAGLKSLERMISHMKDVVKERKEIFASRRVAPVARLQSDKWSEVNRRRLVLNVSGRVMDTNGEPLIGVNVQVKGTNKGTATDLDGHFSLSDIDDQAVLVLSYIGYKTLEVAVDGQSSLNIVMQEDVQTLDEVVVIGYGTVKKSDLTGAVSTVQGDQIAKRHNSEVSQALQGAAAGVMVTRNNNAPGSAANIRIRGITTIGNSNPLIILDGVPVSNINDINPNDIQDISVLKDAASASIYGARAAAGVILVTTKRAKSGEKNLTYSYDYGFEKPTKLPQNVDIIRYLQMANEQRWNDSGNGGNEYPTFSQDYIENYITNNKKNPDLYPITNWNNLIFKEHAPRQSHTLSFSTGTENLSTNASFSFENIEGLYSNNNYKRITARVNNDLTITNYLSATIDLYFKNSDRELPSVGNIVWLTRRMPPQYAAEWTDGRIAGGKIGDNPWGRLEYGGFNEQIANKLGGKASINFTPFKGFKFSSVIAPSIDFIKGKVFNKQVPYYAWDDPTVFEGYLDGQVRTSLNEKRNDNYSITTQFLANYQTSLKKHNINILVGNENFYAFYENLSASRDEFELTSFPYLNLGSLEFRDNIGDAYENAYQSWFGRILYNYANKYFLQGNIRYDGSSRFHPDYRWGSFPSFSAGWVISEESFVEKGSSLSFLKLRASWGTLGNERIGNYPYQATIAFSNALFYMGDEIVSAQGAAQRQYAIEDISWEKTESTNFGFDSYWLDYRFRINADYYFKRTNDMLLPLEIPNFIGFDNPDQNTGKMKTKGWEVELGWNQKLGDIDLSVSANLSDFKSIMGDLGGTEFLGAQIKREGSEFNEWYGYISEGLFQTKEEVENSAVTSTSIKPGDIKYIDVSGPDGKPDGIVSPEYDRVFLGGSLPRYMYGGNVQLLYKNFDFQMVMQGVGKQNARIEPNMARPLQTQNTHVPEYIDGNYWSEYNSSAKNLKSKYPRLSEITAGNNYTMSDFWLFDGSYFRMKNITLGYSLPQQLSEQLTLQNVRIYASGSDLFSFDKYPQGWDPEVAATSYPITTSFVFGVSVKF